MSPGILVIMPNRDQLREDILRTKELCNRILSVSPNIRYAAVMNEFGRTIAGQLRRDIVPLFTPTEARNENYIEATRTRFRRNFDKSIGKTNFTFTENEKVKILVIPGEINFCYVTLDKETKLSDVEQIVEAIRKFFFSNKVDQKFP
jgi:O-succinylbenzoate synthase